MRPYETLASAMPVPYQRNLAVRADILLFKTEKSSNRTAGIQFAKQNSSPVASEILFSPICQAKGQLRSSIHQLTDKPSRYNNVGYGRADDNIVGSVLEAELDGYKI